MFKIDLMENSQIILPVVASGHADNFGCMCSCWDIWFLLPFHYNRDMLKKLKKSLPPTPQGFQTMNVEIYCNLFGSSVYSTEA